MSAAISAAVLAEAGYSPHTASSAKEAMEKLENDLHRSHDSGYYDAGIDGLTVLRTLRSRGNTAPVMLLTARDAVADRVGGLDAGR